MRIYNVIPKELEGYTVKGEKIELNKLWNRRQCTKFNGVPYVTQKSSRSNIFRGRRKKQVKENINYYKENAKIIKQGLEEAGYTVYGGINSPYVWLKITRNKIMGVLR